jgi:hypothetical protein
MIAVPRPVDPEGSANVPDRESAKRTDPDRPPLPVLLGTLAGIFPPESSDRTLLADSPSTRGAAVNLQFGVAEVRCPGWGAGRRNVGRGTRNKERGTRDSEQGTRNRELGARKGGRQACTAMLLSPLYERVGPS